jgi:hypothetical protein
MQGKSLAKSLMNRSGFVVVAELAAGPGFNFAPIEKFPRVPICLNGLPLAR